jgi:hypothetical protein
LLHELLWDGAGHGDGDGDATLSPVTATGLDSAPKRAVAIAGPAHRAAGRSSRRDDGGGAGG